MVRDEGYCVLPSRSTFFSNHHHKANQTNIHYFKHTRFTDIVSFFLRKNVNVQENMIQLS